MNLIQAIQDTMIFKSIFMDLRSWRNWIICLKAIFALPMTKSELKIYRKFTGRKRPPRTPFKEVFLIIGRRGGKSFISALILVFLAVFRQWNLGLERGYIMCIAVDRKQAGTGYPCGKKKSIPNDWSGGCPGNNNHQALYFSNPGSVP